MVFGNPYDPDEMGQHGFAPGHPEEPIGRDTNVEIRRLRSALAASEKALADAKAEKVVADAEIARLTAEVTRLSVTFPTVRAGETFGGAAQRHRRAVEGRARHRYQAR